MSDMDDIMKIKEEAKQKGFHYSWVADHGDKDKTQMIKAQARGYVPVKVSDIEGEHFKGDVRVGVDGLMRVGDAILMKCPDERVESREKERQEQSNASRQAKLIKEEFNATCRASGVQPLEE
jgi:hypothetical protein